MTTQFVTMKTVITLTVSRSIAKLNELFDEGHEIHYWTARGGNPEKDWTELTHKQLKDWNVKHTFNNTVYDVWIDDPRD